MSINRQFIPFNNNILKTIVVSRHKFYKIVFVVIPTILTGMLLTTPSLAEKLNAKCLLQIDGKAYMDGQCWFTSDRYGDHFDDLRLLVTCPNGKDASSCSVSEQTVTREGVFGSLDRDNGVASLCWNEGKFLHAHPCFEGLTRRGACWLNTHAHDRYNASMVSSVKFCAWAK